MMLVHIQSCPISSNLKNGNDFFILTNDFHFTLFVGKLKAYFSLVSKTKILPMFMILETAFLLKSVLV
jgi:hypothetical protein